MAIQFKRQGGGQTSSASPAAPSSLNYGELAVASNGDLYVGNGSRKAVGVLTTNGNKTIGGTMKFSGSTTFNQGLLVGAQNHQETYNISFAKPSSYTYSGHIDCATNNFRIYGQNTSGGTTVAVQAYLGRGTVQLIDNNGNTSFPGTVTAPNFNGIASSAYTFKTRPTQIYTLASDSVGNWCTKDCSCWWFSDTNDLGHKPSDWGFLLNFPYGGDLHQLWFAQPDGNIYHRGGNGGGSWGSYEAWYQLIDSRGGTISGDLRAKRVYNAVYNDYAEYFPRGEETEPGDLIALDLSSKEELYVRARKGLPVVGVHSNEYGHIIGGERDSKEDNLSLEEYNLKHFIPVGLCGRCRVKTVGKISKGQKIVLSDIPGVGRAYNESIDSIQDYTDSIGIAVEDQPIDDNEIRMVRVKLK